MAGKNKRNILSETGPEVSVNMLGTFQLTVGEACVKDDASRSPRIWNLLAYIVMHRDKNIPQEEFIDLLWPEEDIANPANALKTLLYRARATLMPSFGPDLNLILSQRGSYSWNSALPCKVDAEVFADMVQQACQTKLPVERRMELYQEAVSLYKGNFLPKLADQLWVIPLSTYYHGLYVQAVLAYSNLLKEAEKYEEMADVCTNAVSIEAFDERLHGLLITALMRQGKNVAALNHYEKATELLYRNLGVRPSAELRALYQEIMKEQQSLEMDLGVIQEDLRETVARSGAFVCEYGFFREAYRLEVRRAVRQGSCVHIALLTVSLPDGKIPPLDLLNMTMDQLLTVLKDNLRRGDVISRYSGSQYVLLLPTANYEDGTMVMERIIRAFYQQHRKNFLKINYKLQQLGLNDYM
ncbi:MAG: BTAD domain-containing putative transcriptional regulator [Peptococcaceae bacterium]|nr:BTAD domain-containing putative transcriptional regulator [Peptococcaceae bacterium]